MGHPPSDRGDQRLSPRATICDVVIVNWNAGPQLYETLNSLMAHGSDCLGRVIVVDNGSTDGSAAALEDWPTVEVIRASENLGFAAACNLGAAKGNAALILFLNPDTRVDTDSLSVPRAFMARPENAGVGICGIQLVGERGTVSRTCARFATLGRLTASALGFNKLPGFRGVGVHMRDWNHGNTRQVDHVIGAFYLVRRDVFQEMAGFDERFFVYLEDLDLSLRANEAGWDSWYLTEARAFHAGGGTSREIKARRLFYSLRSRLLYSFKHFPRWQAWALVFVTGMVEPLVRTVWGLVRGDLAGVRHTWTAYWMLWRGMGRIVRGEGRFEP